VTLWVKKIVRKEVQFSDIVATEGILGAHNFILVLNFPFPKCGSAPNFVFLEEQFRTR